MLPGSKLCLQSADYDLISSPMMINGIFQKLASTSSLPCISPTTLASKSTAAIVDRTPTHSPSKDTPTTINSTTDSRGQTRTATTLLDKSLTAQEINKYDEILKMKQTASYKLGRLNMKPSEFDELNEQNRAEALNEPNQVSVYSGPLHNDRTLTTTDCSTSTLADRLANARMMAKSGYTWDQSGSCAKVRLGDGAILQNLYPSHSHVKLRNGKVERIDVYCQRMNTNTDVMREITTIKDYEYNQWARTRHITEKEYRDSYKALPFDKLESKSTQPSWDTLRPNNNSYATLGAKNRLFGYENLAAKFSEPKFLKRMGFIDSIADYNPITYTLGSEDDETTGSSKGGDNHNQVPSENGDQILEQIETNSTEHQKIVNSEDDELVIPDDSAESDDILSSDDEEYHNDDEEVEDQRDVLPPERVPSSCRSAKQRLAMYNSDNIIGSKSSFSKSIQPFDLPEHKKSSRPPTTRSEGRVAAMETPKTHLASLKLVDGMSHQQKIDTVSAQLNELDALRSPYKSCSFQPQAIRKDSLKFDLSSSARFSSSDKKFVRFSQPVCLCPKLSKETLNSFYSPTMQRYLASHGSSGFMKCRLHSPSRQAQIREKIILKSL